MADKNSYAWTVNYKGYYSTVHYEPEDKVYSGRVEDITDFVDYEAETPEKAREEFRKAVDDYLDFCKEIGKKPDKPKKE